MLVNFFEFYAAAFLSFNPGFIDSVYEFPMTFYTENGDSVSFEKSTFSENTNKLISLYNELGVKSVCFEIQSNDKLSTSLTLVSVLWSFRDSDNNEIYNATTRYVMKNTDEGLKIKSVFVVDESSKLNRLRIK